MSESYRAIAEYYDPEYEHVEALRRDVPFLMSKMPGKSQRVLEIAVGTGRAAIPLAEAGHRVTGVDFDPGVLEIAKRKRGFVGLTERQLKLVKADARKLRLGETFDWCVILFNTLLVFSSLEELDQVMQSCKRHLKKGGRIWIDIFNPDLALLSERKSYGLDPVTFHVPALDRTVSRVTDLEDVSPGVRRVTFHYRWFLEGEQQNEQVSFELTWMMPREVRLLLERHGFRVEEMWGDYDGGEVTTESPRIVVMGRLK